VWITVRLKGGKVIDREWPISSQELRAEVERKLGTLIPNPRWEALVDRVLTFDENLPPGVRILEAIEHMAESYQAFYGFEDPPSPRTESVSPAGTEDVTRQRSKVLAAYYAAEAAQDMGVEIFRDDALGGSLLPAPTEDTNPVTEWICAAGPDGWKWQDHLLSIRYPIDQHNANVYEAPSEMPPVLRELDELTENLCIRYDWMKGQATHFVLTGRTPTVNPVRAWAWRSTTTPSVLRLSMTIDPTMSPEEVKRVYQFLRKTYFFRDILVRPLSAKAVDLAEFTLASEEFERTADLVRRWNSQHPEHTYDPEDAVALGNFRRDQRVAVKRLLHPPVAADSVLGGGHPPDEPEESDEP
jgi:hypothetical protein